MKSGALLSHQIKCKHFENCSAPICPRDPDISKCIWFPDEPICNLRNVPAWVRKQRRIAKIPGINMDRFFTIEMLEMIDIKEPELQGADPDSYNTENEDDHE